MSGKLGAELSLNQAGPNTSKSYNNKKTMVTIIEHLSHNKYKI